jgi:hypothetical protein
LVKYFLVKSVQPGRRQYRQGYNQVGGGCFREGQDKDRLQKERYPGLTVKKQNDNVLVRV